ncbi:hypothetical protein ES703_96727 [subsurface metagenome]
MDKGLRLGNRAVDEGFGGEIHNIIDRLGRKHFTHRFTVADVALNEAVTLIVLDIFEVIEVAGGGKFVEIYDPRVVMFF